MNSQSNTLLIKRTPTQVARKWKKQDNATYPKSLDHSQKPRSLSPLLSLSPHFSPNIFDFQTTDRLVQIPTNNLCITKRKATNPTKLNICWIIYNLSALNNESVVAGRVAADLKLKARSSMQQYYLYVCICCSSRLQTLIHVFHRLLVRSNKAK